jgi:hypothetical protein
VDINTGEPASMPDRLDALKPAVRECDEIGFHLFQMSENFTGLFHGF